MSILDRFRITRKGPTLRHFTVMITLFALLLFRSVLPDYLANSIFLLAMMGTVWLESDKSRGSLIAYIFFAILGLSVVLVDVLALTYEETMLRAPFGYILGLVTILMLLYCGLLILQSLLRSEHVTANEVVGTVNLYLIIGFIWSYLYSLVELYRPNSFSFSHEVGNLSVNLVYFSFVTLTTLGYGDITPVRPTAQMLTAIEAVIGQLYIALVITYLISIFMAQKTSNSKSNE